MSGGGQDRGITVSARTLRVHTHMCNTFATHSNSLLDQIHFQKHDGGSVMLIDGIMNIKKCRQILIHNIIPSGNC